MDNQTQGVKPPATADLQDPEIKKEAERIKIKMMRLEYYKALAGVILVWLQAFKAEAVSLVTGVGTIIMGYYRIKKWVLRSRTEIKDMRATISPESTTLSGGTAKSRAKVMGKFESLKTSTVGGPSISLEQIPKFGTDDATFIGVTMVFALTVVHFFKRRKKNPETTSS
jgi:hypothetical protein